MMRKHECWNHNSQYHEFLLSKIPDSCLTALDVGCGSGEFAAILSAIFDSVDAIDVDQSAIREAQRKFASCENVTFLCQRFEDMKLQESHYDFVCLIASIHHMDLCKSLELIKRILRPGGVAAILGTYKESTGMDLAYSLVAAPMNLVYRFVKRSAEARTEYRMITKDATETLREIREIMERLLPNHKFGRHLFWRYSVIWKRPMAADRVMEMKG